MSGPSSGERSLRRRAVPQKASGPSEGELLEAQRILFHEKHEALPRRDLPVEDGGDTKEDRVPDTWHHGGRIKRSERHVAL